MTTTKADWCWYVTAVTQIQWIKRQTKQRSISSWFIPLLYIWKILKMGQKSLIVYDLYFPKIALNIFSFLFRQAASHIKFGLGLTNGKQPKCCSGTSEPKHEGGWQLPRATFWNQPLWYETPRPCRETTGTRRSNQQLQANFLPRASVVQAQLQQVNIPWNKTALLSQSCHRIVGDNKLLLF